MPEDNSQNPFANIPQSPTIEVRTLRSDVQSMSDSGGVSMQVEEVREMIGRKVAVKPISQGGSSWFFNIIVLVLVILIAALGVGFVMSTGAVSSFSFFKNLLPGGATTTVVTSTPTPDYVPSSAVKDFDPYADIEEIRFWRIPADTQIDIKLSREAAVTAEDLLTFQQKVARKIQELPASARFVEIRLKKDGDRPADGLVFSSLTGIRIFNDTFFSENFEPNITAFVYRDKRGSWPGYVFRLLPTKSAKTLTPEVQLLERSSTLTSLFLESPGAPSGLFKDSTQLGLPTREQEYSTPGAVIGYGWQDKYFVISTSVDGLKEALRRLLG